MKSFAFSKLFLALFILMSLVSTATAAVDQLPEPLLAIEFKSGEVSIAVVQKGCTFKNSFRFVVQSDGEKQLLTVLRIGSDDCKMFPQREVFTYSAEEIGLNIRKPVVVTNPFVSGALLADMYRSELAKKLAQSLEKTSEYRSDLRERAIETFRQIRVR